MTTKTKTPTWFMVVSIIALIWNIMGVMAYLSQAYMPQEVLDLMSEAERTLMESTPAWVTAAFAIAVFMGTLGCLMLVLKKRIAKMLLLVSLVGIVVQMFWNFFIGDTFEVYGLGKVVMPIMVLIFGVLLVRLANKAITNKWIA
ncbi:MAG: hypothetical protein JKY48_17100 [Flavobacteriales bacterium]|nr:hypothetical protein [Flavobacteriales bacterium]